MSSPAAGDAAREPALDQAIGAQVGALNAARAAAEAAAVSRQEEALAAALAEMQIAREFINDPGTILGSAATKHGETAETVEIAVRRARDALNYRDFSADIEPNRISPIDYWIDGDPVQSKFINGSNKTLQHVLDHMEKYEDFPGKGYYHIPKDQYEQIMLVRSGDTAGLSDKSVRAMEGRIRDIEAKTGRPFESVVKPSISTYPEVQNGKVHDTLDRHEGELQGENERLKDEIRADHEPSLADGLRTAASAAAIAGAFGFVVSAGSKYFREGKNVFAGDFTAEDWKAVGLDTARSAGAGAVTGGAVYLLTNYAGTSAPLASAFVSAARGLAALEKRRQAGGLSEGAFVDEALLVCSDVALVSIGSAAGQALIPVPVLGALAGSFAAKAAGDILKGLSANAAAAVQQRAASARKALDEDRRRVLRELEARFLPLEQMSEFAFDIQRNKDLFASSITMARMLGVPEARILKSPGDVRRFLQGPHTNT